MKKKEFPTSNKISDTAMKEAIEESGQIFDSLCNENPDLFKDNPLNKMSIGQALASNNPLENIRCEMGEKPVQKIFSLLYAAILEVNSAGAGILFDRFSKEQIETIYTYYSSVGAVLFCRSIDKIRSYIKEKLGETYSADDYFELCETKEYINIDREITLQYKEMADEMETALIKFAEQNVERLENR